jgi:hypothetical protein
MGDMKLLTTLATLTAVIAITACDPTISPDGPGILKSAVESTREAAGAPDELAVTVNTACYTDGTWGADFTVNPPTRGGEWHLIVGYDVVAGWMPDTDSYTIERGPFPADQPASSIGIQWRLDTDEPTAAPRWDEVTAHRPDC